MRTVLELGWSAGFALTKNPKARHKWDLRSQGVQPHNMPGSRHNNVNQDHAHKDMKVHNAESIHGNVVGENNGH